MLMLLITGRKVKDQKFICTVVTVKTCQFLYIAVAKRFLCPNPVTALPACKYKQGISSFLLIRSSSLPYRLPLVESTSVILGSKEVA